MELKVWNLKITQREDSSNLVSGFNTLLNRGRSVSMTLVLMSDLYTVGSVVVYVVSMTPGCNTVMAV